MAMVLAGSVMAADNRATGSTGDRDQAQQQRSGTGDRQDQSVAVGDWDYEPLYAAGWSVERLFQDTQVVDNSGEQIGSIENVIFDDRGEILAVIAEVGGFWDVGDTHVSIPWDEVRLSADARRMEVPVSETSVENYGIFNEGGYFSAGSAGDVGKVDDDLETGPSVFKATDLIGDYAYLQDGERYGYVNDIIVNDGRVSAVVVDATSYRRPGYYAYPYNRYGALDRDYARYTLPYGSDEIVVVDPFDYDRMKRGRSDEGDTGRAG